MTLCTSNDNLSDYFRREKEKACNIYRVINSLCFSVFDGLKFRGAPATIVLMAIGGSLHHFFFVRVTGVVKSKDNKKKERETTKFHGARAALKGDRGIAAREPVNLKLQIRP